VVGEGLADGLDDEPLRFPVDRGHQVDRRLEGDFLAAAAARPEQATGTRSRGQRDALELVHRDLLARGPGTLQTRLTSRGPKPSIARFAGR
jgi:hypothetical protein